MKDQGGRDRIEDHDGGVTTMKESRDDADWVRRDSMSKADPRNSWATQKGPEERLPDRGSLRGQTCPGPRAWEGLVSAPRLELTLCL